MASDTFTMKKEAAQSIWLAPLLAIVFGIFSLVFAGPISEQAGDMSPGTAKLVMNGLGLLLLVGGAYYVYVAYQTGKRFVTLSDDGVNIDDKWVFQWADIESVEEEAVPIKAKGVTVTTKYRLWIRYQDRATQSQKKTFIISDFEGYSFIKERITGMYAQQRSG